MAQGQAAPHEDKAQQREAGVRKQGAKDPREDAPLQVKSPVTLPVQPHPTHPQLPPSHSNQDGLIRSQLSQTRHFTSEHSRSSTGACGGHLVSKPQHQKCHFIINRWDILKEGASAQTSLSK